MTPAVSVVIPAYNMAGFIGEALASVAAQTFSDYEVIVVNDGSPDTAALEAALAPWRERIVYLTQPNGGPSKARNAALAVARGEWVAFLDADDLWMPEYLEVQTGMLRADAGLDVVYPNGIIFGDSPDAGLEYKQLSPSAGEVTFTSILTGRCNVMIGSTVRRAALERAGGFDEALRWCEDFDLWLRLAQGGSRFAYHDRVLVRMRRHGTSASADVARMYANQIRVFEKCERTLALSAAEREAVARQKQAARTQQKMAEGKQAFERGEMAAARAAMAEANRELRSPKVTAAVWALGLCPGLVRWLYRRRYGR